MDLTPSQASSSEEEPAGAQRHQEPGVTPAPDAAAAPAPALAPAPAPASASVTAPASADAGAVGRGTATRTGKEIGGKKFRVGTGDEYVPFRSRTKRRRRMIVTAALAALLLAAGGYGVVSLFSSPAQAPAATACANKANAAAAARTVEPKLPAAAQIKLNVYNSTGRQGLAAATAATLKQRGFAIGKVTNDPLKANLTVSAQIRGATASAPAMRVVAAEVAGSQLKPDARTDGTVDLVLGSGFTALASPDQVSAALKAATAAPVKASSACAS